MLEIVERILDFKQLGSNQILSRLPIYLTQLNAGNNSEFQNSK